MVTNDPSLLSRRNAIRWSMAAIPAVGAIMLTGCGGSQASKRTVDMVDMTYDPADLTVPVGTTVTWVNDSTFVHTVTTDPSLLQDGSLVTSPPGQAFDSGNIAPGDSWSRTFDVPGEYRYACIPHELAGMVARLVVEP